MNGFIEVIFLSLILSLTFYFGKNNFDFMKVEKLEINDRLRVMQKFVVIFVVFFGYFVLQLMGLPFEKSQPNLGEVVVKCLLTTLFAFLGVTLYFDIMQLVSQSPTKTGKIGYNLVIELIAIIGSIISFSYFTNLGPRVEILSTLQTLGTGAFNIGKTLGTGVVNVGKEVGIAGKELGEKYVDAGKQLV